MRRTNEFVILRHRLVAIESWLHKSIIVTEILKTGFNI